MTQWPTMLPPDLRRVLDGTLSGRQVMAADVWTDVREWLIKHGVAAPEGLPVDVMIERLNGQRD